MAALAGDDAEARRRWQAPADRAGRGDHRRRDRGAATSSSPTTTRSGASFTRAQNRDITQALSSLGFRFDGLGGWVDGRAPIQRDLSLALGYAGLDPMRDPALAERGRDGRACSATWRSPPTSTSRASAGDLTLGELVTMLGRRADGLAELWNQWGRVRPLLLEES